MDGKDRLIEELRATVVKQAAQLEEQAARIAELELELVKAKKNSTTSSTSHRPVISQGENPR